MAAKEQRPTTEEEKFFGELKDARRARPTTSKIGIHKEMEYKGNVLLEEYAGTDVSKS